VAKKIIISLETDIEPVIFGIAANDQAYRISWILNEKFNLQLKEDPAFILQASSNELSFNAFSQEGEDSVCVKLIANKFGKKTLHSKYKTIDFFVFIFCKEFINKDFLKMLRNESGILAAYKLEVDSGFQKIIKKL